MLCRGITYLVLFLREIAELWLEYLLFIILAENNIANMKTENEKHYSLEGHETMLLVHGSLQQIFILFSVLNLHKSQVSASISFSKSIKRKLKCYCRIQKGIFNKKKHYYNSSVSRNLFTSFLLLRSNFQDCWLCHKHDTMLKHHILVSISQLPKNSEKHFYCMRRKIIFLPQMDPNHKPIQASKNSGQLV